MNPERFVIIDKVWTQIPLILSGKSTDCGVWGQVPLGVICLLGLGTGTEPSYGFCVEHSEAFLNISWLTVPSLAFTSRPAAQKGDADSGEETTKRRFSHPNCSSCQCLGKPNPINASPRSTPRPGWVRAVINMWSLRLFLAIRPSMQTGCVTTRWTEKPALSSFQNNKDVYKGQHLVVNYFAKTKALRSIATR